MGFTSLVTPEMDRYDDTVVSPSFLIPGSYLTTTSLTVDIATFTKIILYIKHNSHPGNTNTVTWQGDKGVALSPSICVAPDSVRTANFSEGVSFYLLLPFPKSEAPSSP